MKIDLIITGGAVVTSKGVLNTDIAVVEEKIIAIGDKKDFPVAERTVNAKGKVVIPGGIDTHSHFEISFMGAKAPETWEIGTIATAIGGTTTTIDFAEQSKGKSLLDAVKKQLERASALSVVDYTTKAILTDFSDLEKELSYMKEVMDLGIPSFKGATIYKKVGWYEDDWQLFSVLRHVKELGGLMTLHTENCLIGEGLQAELVSQDKTDPKYHGIAKPSFVENMDIMKVMMIAEELGTKVDILHVTTKEGPRIIDNYRKKGLDVFCETCPHYLMLTKKKFEPKLPNGIMYMASPPLRTQDDIEGLWDGIKNGTVHTIGSDHDAFTKAQKQEHSESFVDIPNGFPGCEVRVPIMFSEGVLKRKLALETFAAVVSTNAAKMFGLYPRKGVIQIGSDADMVILDPEKKHSLNADSLHMGTDLSIYEGMNIKGWPIMTILRGQVIVENDKFVGNKGCGQFVKGTLNEDDLRSI